MAKGKKAIDVDKDKLMCVIEELEKNNKYTTRSALFNAASEKYTSDTGIKISPSVVYLRVKQFAIPIKTQKAVVDPAKFREKLANAAIKNDDSIVPKCKQTVSELLMYADEKEKAKWIKLAKSVLRGSRKAAIKFNCIQCANFQPKEVKLCPMNTCPFYLYRPYQ